jgi:hypothetical protein
MDLIEVDNDDHVAVRIRLWTAPTSGPIVHPAGVTWRSMVDWYRQGKPPDSSPRALWQSYQQSCLVASMRDGWREWEFWLAKYFVHTCKWCFTCRKILRHGASSFTSLPIEGVQSIFIALENPSPPPDLNPRTVGPMANMLTITPPRRLEVNLDRVQLKDSVNTTMNIRVPLQQKISWAAK